MSKRSKNKKLLNWMFWITVSIFVFLNVFIMVPIDDYLKNKLFRYAGILGILMLVSGGALIYFARRSKLKKKRRILFILTGLSPIVAFVSVIGGVILGVRFVKGKFKEGVVLGFGLRPKGDIGFVLGALALEAGLITDQIFTSLVLMALIVTIVSTIVFKKMVLSKSFS